MGFRLFLDWSPIYWRKAVFAIAPVQREAQRTGRNLGLCKSHCPDLLPRDAQGAGDAQGHATRGKAKGKA
jgi:hypothetical protein